MKINIRKRYNHQAVLLNLLNPIDIGLDQYEPNFANLGSISCFFGVNLANGDLAMYTPEIIKQDNPYISNPVNAAGVPLGQQNFLWRLSAAIPVVNAYGQVSGFRYELSGGTV